MAAQNYRNHRKFYPPHHYVFLPLCLGLMVYGIIKIFKTDAEEKLIWGLFSITVFLILFLAVMLRQHYALGNQNRIIRLEFKQRYFELFGKRSDPVEEQLNFGQIAGLRFAGDDEFKILLNRALTEKLSEDDIKKSIEVWRSDHNRV
ncbi:DUF6526 family protein [Epilithonimonas vandammei]|uniref:DUF6526 family protein n=1 Tax=Epilithonimonas vandammei TaxID=2487072 RepID=UPI0028AB5ADA|nr:DUF6526 family protein [Epilithonimonas vandammei]